SKYLQIMHIDIQIGDRRESDSEVGAIWCGPKNRTNTGEVRWFRNSDSSDSPTDLVRAELDLAGRPWRYGPTEPIFSVVPYISHRRLRRIPYNKIALSIPRW